MSERMLIRIHIYIHVRLASVVQSVTHVHISVQWFCSLVSYLLMFSLSSYPSDTRPACWQASEPMLNHNVKNHN